MGMLLSLLDIHSMLCLNTRIEGGMEEKIAAKNNIPFYPIKAIKLDRTKLLRNLKIPFVLPKYIKER